MTTSSMSEFVTVYPPPPPTWNHLNSAQRSTLRRSTRKVSKVLGTGMSITVGGNASPPPPPPATKPTKRRVSFLRLFTSSPSPSPPSCEPGPPVLRFSNQPATPTFIEPPTSPNDEGASKRAKLARVQRLLGDDVPVEMVFPTTLPSRPNTPGPTTFDSRRPHTPLPLPHDSMLNHVPRSTVIRIPIPTLTKEEKRSLGLDNERLQSVQEEDEPASSSASQISNEERTLSGSSQTALGYITEKSKPPMTLHPFLAALDLDDDDPDDSQWTTGSYQSSPTPSAVSIPFCASPSTSSFISIHEDDADEFDTPVSTWFDGDGQSITLSRSASSSSSHFSFHADRSLSDSSRTIESDRTLQTPPPFHTFPSSLIGFCGHTDDIEPISELTDALFASPIQPRWSAAPPTLVF